MSYYVLWYPISEVNANVNVREPRLTAFPGASVKFRARSALASSFIYCDKSWVRMEYASWLVVSARSERYAISAESADGATGSESWASSVSANVTESQFVDIRMETDASADPAAGAGVFNSRRGRSSAMFLAMNSPTYRD